MQNKNRIHKIVTVCLFGAVLITIPIISAIFMPKEAQPFSENENRYLAKFPTISGKAITEKTFMNGFDSWVSDRFIDREQWIGVKNGTEKLIGKTEINGVFTENDRMMQVWTGYDESAVNRSLDAVNAFAERHSDISVSFMLVPNAQEIYSDTLPQDAVVGNMKSFIKYCYDRMTNVEGIDVYSSLYANRDRYIFYRTDHHWTSLGAYFGYTAAAGKLDYSPYELDSFNIEHASSSFEGTLFSKTLDSSVTPDIIDFYTLAGGDPSLKLSISEGSESKVYDSLYFRDFLGKKDKYSSFTGSNSPIMTIETDLGEGNDRSLLIFKDSYAHCLLPFLTKHYSKITVLDMRYINVDYRNFVNPDDYERVLFVYNVITFSEDANLKKLNMAESN